jgi:hypothetical protein
MPRVPRSRVESACAGHAATGRIFAYPAQVDVPPAPGDIDHRERDAMPQKWN